VLLHLGENGIRLRAQTVQIFTDRSGDDHSREVTPSAAYATAESASSQLVGIWL
jgi:hypothetical protein